MRKITFSDATREAMAEMMEKYPEVFVMGEDIARQGGIFGQFKGLPAEFPGRVIDTPISETFIVGGGVGAALAGARPVVDMHFADFIGVAMDEVLNQMAKVRYMFGGQAKVPLVLRAPDGLVGGGAAQHSQCVESWFIHVPGVKVVAPSNPYDAKMVLKAAIESDDPVLYFENKVLYKESGEMPEKCDEVPYEIGKARVEREGKDVTIVSYSIGMKNARAAADLLAKEGISAEVIDLITLSPWDKETVLNSVKKTHKVCLVAEAVKQGGVMAEVAAVIAEEALEYLDAPVLRYGAPFTPIPFAPTLEKMYRVFPEDLVSGIKGIM
ncbi:MAG: alpha-ketoacid dehydrogenase subunit beta [Oscillospiraceae bacterium]|nr:alpha-ketoacid dehydrogenase subunit beta [Oscillospiraceae bacterium]